MNLTIKKWYEVEVQRRETISTQTIGNAFMKEAVFELGLEKE